MIDLPVLGLGILMGLGLGWNEVERERRALAEEREALEEERARSVRQVLGRMAIYLRHRIESPLLKGLDEGAGQLRIGADAALDAVEDLEFFLEASPVPSEPAVRNLAELVREVTREFANQSPVLVKVLSPPEAIRVRVDPEPIKDAIFLVLHNAADFGGGEPVELILGEEGNRARITVKDQGPGFSAEALLKAMNPFYSTSPGGLGLGLPHARNAVKAQGGEIRIRNAESGGAEVDILLQGVA
jgi:signal transduction histidine kinase